MNFIKIRTKIPGPKSIKLMRWRTKFVSSALYHQTPIFVSHAKGAIITDVDGNSMIDFTGGISVNNVGHCNPRVVNAVMSQSKKLIHGSINCILYEKYISLAELLCKLTPGKFSKQAIFFNSGAEAVENSAKIARHYTKRIAICGFEHGFSGRTMLALSLTHKVKPYKHGFGPFMEDVYHLPTPYVYRRPDSLTEKEYVDFMWEKFQDQFTNMISPDNVAAIITEPILGEGGIIVQPQKYLKNVAKFCKKEGILFVADEIQTGFGRTGKMFAMEHYGINPDLICLAKSIAGGLPLSAVIGKKSIMNSFEAGELGGTFGGNPVACEAGIAVLEEFKQKKLVKRAEKIGKIVNKRFKEIQQKSKFVGDVRGLGAMQAIEFVEDKKTKKPYKKLTDDIIKKSYENGVLLFKAGTYGNVIRTMMPLVITEAQLNEAINVIEKVILSFNKKE